MLVQCYLVVIDFRGRYGAVFCFGWREGRDGCGVYCGAEEPIVFFREEEVQDEEADATKEGSKYRSFSVLSREDGDVACWGVHPVHTHCVWLEDIFADIGGVRALS